MALPERASGTLLEVARFRSGGQEYALETRFVHEVLRGAELTPCPGAPPVLRGLTLLRGEVLPVVELAPLFGRPASGTARRCSWWWAGPAGAGPVRGGGGGGGPPPP